MDPASGFLATCVVLRHDGGSGSRCTIRRRGAGCRSRIESGRQPPVFRSRVTHCSDFRRFHQWLVVHAKHTQPNDRRLACGGFGPSRLRSNFCSPGCCGRTRRYRRANSRIFQGPARIVGPSEPELALSARVGAETLRHLVECSLNLRGCRLDLNPMRDRRKRC